VPQIDISPAKVAFLIVKAREFQANFAPLDEGDQETSGEQRLVENQAQHPSLQEFQGVIRSLNDDEKANLVAIAWIGRGTFGQEDWEKALHTARQEKITSTVEYLAGMPMLADTLAEGMAALGIDMAAEESNKA
jgi:hypothetical protein